MKPEEHMKMKLFVCTLGLLIAATAPAETIIADSASSLTWQDSGGAASTLDGTTLNIVADKNSQVTAGFSGLSLANDGDYLTVQFDLARSGPAMADDGSTLEIWFDGTHGYAVAFEPFGGANQAIFRETGDTNLGKFNSLAIGSTAQTVSFTISRILTGNGLELTATGDLVDTTGNTKTVESDLVFDPATTFSEIYFKFPGSGWINNDQNISISNFSVTTSVPEPAMIGMLGLGGLLTILLRKLRV